MRRVKRKSLAVDVEQYLSRRQSRANDEHAAGTLDTGKTWDVARQTKKLDSVLGVLQGMAGDRQRCMYCSDSVGTDIEHFWPKSIYPERMFLWSNLLLCCTGCGRDRKGTDFPLDSGMPLLVDPTVDDPWEHLDFSASTGVIIPRMDRNGVVSAKGEATVNLLWLDRRDCITIGYMKSFRRIRRAIRAAIDAVTPVVADLISELKDADDHGLLGWCFRGNGTNEHTMVELRERLPAAWDACVDAFGET